MPEETETESISRLAIAGIGVDVIDNHPYALVPAGYSVDDLERLQAAPSRIKAKVALATVTGFIAYVERFKDNSTAIFAHPESGKVAAVLDYHEPTKPSWTTHRASFAPENTVEWKRWIGQNDKWMEQRAFAEFIEMNVADITRPSGAEMLEIASTLEAKTAVDFKSGVRLDNGTNRLSFAAETVAKAGDKGTLDIPQQFELALTPFVGGETYPIIARFRYKIHEGKLTLRYQLVSPHKVIEAAVNSTVEKISNGTGVSLFIGSEP